MRRILIATLAMGIAGPALWASAAADPAAAPDVDQGIVIRTFPGVVIDTKTRQVRLEGKVCQREGPLELLACRDGTREHESVIAVQAAPSHVVFALAMLGLREGRSGRVTPGGSFSPPAGDEVAVSVRFATAKRGAHAWGKEVPAWELIRPAGSAAVPPRPMDWVFIGRQSREALAAADREGTVICLSNFPEAVLDVPFESTDDNARLLYMANPGAVPAVDTPAEVVLRPTNRRIEPRKIEIEVVLKKGRPPALDGKEMSLEALRTAVEAEPPHVRSALVRADPDETFGRVMVVHDILRDALMRVTLVVLDPSKEAAGGPEKPPLEVAVTADNQVRARGRTLSIEDLRQQAADLFKDVARVQLAAEKGTSWKTVAEVMDILREQGTVATVSLQSPE